MARGVPVARRTPAIRVHTHEAFARRPGKVKQQVAKVAPYELDPLFQLTLLSRLLLGDRGHGGRFALAYPGVQSYRPRLGWFGHGVLSDARVMSRSPQHEAGALGAQHLIWRHDLDSESYARVRDL